MNFDVNKYPQNPGIYIYKDKSEKIIYIGKAKNLRKRIASYFQKNVDRLKTKLLVEQIHSIDFIIVDSEVEALLLENKFIKLHKPKYNIALKDSKTYAYLKITDEEIPQLKITRIKSKKGTYFGPYSDSNMRNVLHRLAISLFQIITPKTFSSKSKLYYEIGLAPAESLKKVNKENYLKQVNKVKEFLNGKTVHQIIKQLKVEMQKKAENKEYERALKIKSEIEYLYLIEEKQKVDTIKSFDQDYIVFKEKQNKLHIQLFSYKKGVLLGKEKFIFENETNTVIDFIKQYYSSKSWIPKEIILPESIWENNKDKEILEEFLSTIRESKVLLTIPQKGDKKKLLLMLFKNINTKKDDEDLLLTLKEKINLKKYPKIIECFDMSNLGSEHLIGAMTQWIDGKRNTKGYRKFEIKTFSKKQDDIRAMKEVVFRRYTRVKREVETKKNEKENSDNSYPDLIIIDGGKTHLMAAYSQLEKLNLNIPIISIAKGAKRDKNEIFVIGKDEPYIFNNNEDFMLLLRKIRDSVHNLVITYNRKKQDIKLKKSFQD